MDAHIDRLAGMAERIAGSEAVEKDDTGFTIDDPRTLISVFTAPGDSETALCRAKVCEFGPESCDGELAEAALMGNFFWKATDGAVLSLSGDGRAIFLTDRFDEGAFDEDEDFAAYLDAFMATLEEWRTRFETMGATAGEEVSK